jgi:predicted transcriptional regulator
LTAARIRREHFIRGKTIKEIARDLKASRNTVRKVLRSIFCASATLIERNERKKKEKKGLEGAVRGQVAAALDATGVGKG